MACIFRENGNIDIQELSECDFGAFRMVCNVCVFTIFPKYINGVRRKSLNFFRLSRGARCCCRFVVDLQRFVIGMTWIMWKFSKCANAATSMLLR